MSKFKDRIIQIVNLVPSGTVVSYGQVALMAGVPKAAQAVGQVLHLAEKDTPWWRVINNAGRISTNCMEHPAVMQKQLLESEGVKVTKDLKIDIEKYRFIPDPKVLRGLELDDEYVRLLLERFFT